jgi:biotin operon repressor
VQKHPVLERLTAFRAKVQAHMDSLQDEGEELHDIVTGAMRHY